jgi:hypothetical protein
LKLSSITSYLLGIPFGMLLGLAGLHMLLLSVDGLRWNPDSQYISEWYAKKEKLIASISDEKLIIAGGSGAFFGVRAEQMQMELGIPSINFGTHAALPLSYLIERVKNISNSGDIVLFLPEYEYYFTPPAQLNPVALKYLLSCDPSFLRKDAAQYFDVLMKTPPDLIFPSLFYSGKKLRLQLENRKKETENIISEWGDRNYTSISNMGERERKLIQKVRPGSLATFNPSTDYEPPAFPVLREFAEWCKTNQILFLLSYPNTMIFPEYQKEAINHFHEQLTNFCNSNEIVLVGTPLESMFEEEAFFDTIYHLNSEWAQIRTARLLSNLQAHPDFLKFKENKLSRPR